jgi:hypothetical protein
MHGGMKVYAGSPAAARQYLEAGCGRPDDYYLTEGTGFARRFTATEGHVREMTPLTGDTYETWVAGHVPATGEPRGQLRTDGRAVRFVEVVVNGPKTWSLAAALHPDVAAAYEAAQDRAAEQIIAWLAVHATTRVGPRGGQVRVPVEVAEAVTPAVKRLSPTSTPAATQSTMSTRPASHRRARSLGSLGQPSREPAAG